MRAVFGFIGILLVLGIGWIVYSIQLKSGPDGELLPQQSNLIAIRQDLLSLGQAERLYHAANGQYATIDQLTGSGVVSRIPQGGRWGYDYRVESLSPGHFVITAVPKIPGPGSPAFYVDETLRISP